MKLKGTQFALCIEQPAAFGRLCVETQPTETYGGLHATPAAFGRLCVETKNERAPIEVSIPAAFGRLCVETVNI